MCSSSLHIFCVILINASVANLKQESTTRNFVASHFSEHFWRLSYTPLWVQHKEEVEVHHIFVVKSILSSQVSNMYVPIAYKFYRKVSVKCISDGQYEPSFSR